MEGLDPEVWKELPRNYWDTIPPGTWVKYVFDGKSGPELKYGGLFVEHFSSDKGEYIKIQSTVGNGKMITVKTENVIRLFKKKDYNDRLFHDINVRLTALERQIETLMHQIASSSRMGQKRSSLKIDQNT